MRWRVRGCIGGCRRRSRGWSYWPGAVLALPEAPDHTYNGQHYHEGVHDAVLAEEDFVDFHRDTSKE
jgi:hypothetical protein